MHNLHFPPTIKKKDEALEHVKISLTQRFYQWFMIKTQSPYATWLLNVFSFLESSIFPIPPDIMLIPMIIADRTRAWFLSLTCSISSILGGLAGYAIGYYLFESLGVWIIEKYSLQSAFANFQTLFQEYGFWIIILNITIMYITRLYIGQFEHPFFYK